MHLASLKISNFRAISELSLHNIASAIVLAGPNGCGKSCILNAIRLLKSSYGSYEQDEYTLWMQESQIDLSKDAKELHPIFQDVTRPVHVSAEFTLSDHETGYLKNNLRELLEKSFWTSAVQQQTPFQPRRRVSLAAQQRTNKQMLDGRLAELSPLIQAALENPTQRASLTIPPAGVVDVVDNHLLEFIFATYDPQNLGVIDYHSPHRTYSRVKLNSVNLTIDSNAEQQQRQTALYGTKHGNVKTEMTSAYVRNLIARDADAESKPEDLLTSTIKELFATFLPGKEFLGPVPMTDGSLQFPVRLVNGITHDIDDLSSGEKEVVYGYLRLHSSAPKNSIIMIDEPELHLNPKLLGGLADFYYRHLGARLNNQLWLVSHSDILIREAVVNPSYDVYHIQPPTALEGNLQAIQVRAANELDQLLIDLVGDMASYRPGNKIVVFESTPEAAFDKRMVATLFPEFAHKVNFVSAGSKKLVLQLQHLLERAREEGHVNSRFFAITDRDAEAKESLLNNQFVWDRYHIESYLLEPQFIFEVVRSVHLESAPFKSSAEVLNSLNEIANDLTPSLVAHQILIYVESVLKASSNVSIDATRSDAALAAFEGVERSLAKVTAARAKDLSLPVLSAMESELLMQYRGSLSDGQWLCLYRGRDILKRFAGTYLRGMTYEFFRNSIIDKMVQVKFQPPGMKEVIDKILA